MGRGRITLESAPTQAGWTMCVTIQVSSRRTRTAWIRDRPRDVINIKIMHISYHVVISSSLNLKSNYMANSGVKLPIGVLGVRVCGG